MVDDFQMFNKAVKIAHLLIAQKVREGDTVVDATMGNGRDTLFLAQCVGSTGKVYAFDVQPQALANTAALLHTSGVGLNIELIQDGHENLDRYILGPVRLVLFNLGYLPGGNRNFYTRVETTLAALVKGLSWLEVNGLLLMVIYPGHPEGKREKQEILQFAAQLPLNKYNAFFLDLINHVNHPPVLLGIERSA